MVEKEQNFLDLIAESHGITMPGNRLPSKRFSSENIPPFVYQAIDGWLSHSCISD